MSQIIDDPRQNIKGDSLSGHEQRQINRAELKRSKARFNIYTGAVFAQLHTQVSFELAHGLLSATVGLEEHLGLPGKSTFYDVGFRYRFTPVSGIYAFYYGINRQEEKHTTIEIIFLHDTIEVGLNAKAYFNTQVVSVGYLLSAMQDPNAFLSFYFNIYMMDISTGIEADIGHVDENINFLAPLPNFGLIADFRIFKWLHFGGNVGFFSLHTDSFGGTIYDLRAEAIFKPAKWIGISVSYQEFDINLFFPVEKIKTVVDYNFKGPSLGMYFTF